MTDNKGLADITFASTATYRIVQELGRGGMGIVYLAEKNNEGVIDHVVLKTIRTVSHSHVDRLRREANVATVLRHENIVKTYGLEAIPVAALPAPIRERMSTLQSLTPSEARLDMNTETVVRPTLAPPMIEIVDKRAEARALSASDATEDAKLYCMAMDYVDGTDLGVLHRDHLRSEHLIVCEMTGFVLSRISRALAYAHQHIVHRDISPENIMVDNHGVAKLTDFGVAVVAGEIQEFAGKVPYMSPEQLNEEEVDGRADIFSLGIVAYQVLTGVCLFVPPSDAAFLQAMRYVRKRMSLPIPPPHEVRRDIPRVLSAIVMRMLERNRKQRYQHMTDVGNDLEKQYLYARGYGPTNSSLAAYVEIFNGGFTDFDPELIKQLSFLKGRDGKFALSRAFRWNEYTPTGKRLIEETQQGQLMHKVLQRHPAEQFESSADRRRGSSSSSGIRDSSRISEVDL